MSAFPTFTSHALPGDFRLAINTNKKMKTIAVQAFLVGNLDETATRKALVPMILRRGTRSLPDMLALNRHLEGLYGTSLVGAVQKIGEWLVLQFRLDLVNERFVPGERGLLRRALEVLRDLMWDPFLVDGAFRGDWLDQEKNNLKLSIESLVDNKDAWAAWRLVEEMCRGEPFARHEQGRVEDLPGIDAASLARDHGDWVRSLPLHVYLAGDVDVSATREILGDVFSPRSAPRTGGYRLTGAPAAVPVGAVREFEDRMKVNQARLHLGFRHGITYRDPRYEALIVMNGVLGAGGFSHSKLFQNVREKASLAYGVHSWLERTKGLLFIASGIAPEKRSEAESIILEQVAAVARGDISAEELEASRAMILNSNRMLEDNPAAVAELDFGWGLNGRKLDAEEYRARIAAVDRDAIVDAARSLRHDATYFLTAE